MRRRRSKTKWILLAVLLLFVLACGLLLRFVFVVRSVEVQGNSGAVSDDGVVRAARIGFGSSILKVDEEDIRQRINATGVLEFVDMAVRYPDTVILQVAPRSREAMILNLGKIRVLDERGYVVETLDDVPDMDLIYVSGLRVLNAVVGSRVQGESAQVDAYCAVIQALNAHAAEIYVSELDVSDPENMRIITRTGITVELGDARNMPDKVAWMKSAVADLEKRSERGGVLDVTSGTKADYRAAAPAQQ